MLALLARATWGLRRFSPTAVFSYFRVAFASPAAAETCRGLAGSAWVYWGLPGSAGVCWVPPRCFLGNRPAQQVPLALTDGLVSGNQFGCRISIFCSALTRAGHGDSVDPFHRLRHPHGSIDLRPSFGAQICGYLRPPEAPWWSFLFVKFFAFLGDGHPHRSVREREALVTCSSAF